MMYLCEMYTHPNFEIVVSRTGSQLTRITFMASVPMTLAI